MHCILFNGKVSTDSLGTCISYAHINKDIAYIVCTKTETLNLGPVPGCRANGLTRTCQASVTGPIGTDV